MNYRYFNVSIYLKAWDSFTEVDVQRAMLDLLNSHASTFEPQQIVVREP